MELRKKMEEIYSKLNNLGDDAVLKKSSEERKVEYKNIKKEEEIRRIEELEKKMKNPDGTSGLFSTQI